MKEKISVGFRLVKIETLEFAIIKEGFNKKSDEEIPIFIGLEISYSVQNPNRNTVACTVDLSLSQNDIPFLNLN